MTRLYAAGWRFVSRVLLAACCVSAAHAQDIDIKSKGAVGNGSADDTAAIQAGINGSQPGDRIVFPAGTYRLTNTLTFLSNRTYAGINGPVLKSMEGNTANTFFTARSETNNTHNLTITGLTFDGGGLMFDGTVLASNVHFYNNIVRNINSLSGNWTVQGGILIASGMTASSFDHNLFTHLGDAPGVSGGAIHAYDLDQTSITDNRFDSVYQGISLSDQGPDSRTYSNVVMSRNTFSKVHRMGIETQPRYLDHLYVEDNDVRDSLVPYYDTFGLSIVPGGHTIYIRNNTVVAFPAAATNARYGYGIEVGSDGTGGVEVSGNIVYGYFWYGIVLGYVQYVTVENNTLSGAGTASSIAWEVPVQPNAVIQNNSISQVLGPIPPLKDNSAPIAAIMSPNSGVSLTGSTTVCANAADNVGVASVTFSVDGTPVVTTSAYPFQATIDTTVFANGAHTLTAIAKDAAGNSTVSAPVSITTSNGSTPPPPPTPVNWQRIVVDPAPGANTLEKALADINGDGKLDIIIGYSNNGGVYWYEFPASGNPQDTWIKHTIRTSGDCYEHMQIMDVNGDGRPDIVLSIDNSIKWLQHPGGNGTGTWAVHDITSGIGHEVRLADIDGDGKLDIVTSRTRNIDFQNSPDSWQIVGWGQTAAGNAADGMGLLDIGSGKGAINIVGATSSGIYWFENPREHGGNARTDPWTAHRIGNNYGSDSGPAIACLDVDGDGRVDVITAPNEGTQGSGGLIWWQAPADPRNGTWTAHTIDSSYQAVHWIEIADVNSDGHPDLIVTEEEQSHDVFGQWNYNDDRVAVFYNDGKGNFVQQVIETTGGQNQVAGDVDGDGDIDFVSVNHGVYGAPNPIELFLNLKINSGGGSGGSIQGSLATAAASYNLTALGTLDWAQWGGEGAYSNFDHKASGGGKISTITTVGSGGNFGWWNDAARTTSWSDGTPTASAAGNHGYIWSNGALGTGFTFSAPADKSQRVLSIYCGASAASATLTAHLSDGSAADFSKAFTGPGAVLYTITYNAGSANQNLRVTLLKTGNNAGSTDGSADLIAAWLNGGGPVETPYGGAPWPIPGTVQAENFDEGGEGVAYHDADAGNNGGGYRNTDVDVRSCSDTGAGYQVGWTATGEWMKYTVNVAASGNYTLSSRVASGGSGGTLHIEFDGTNVSGPISIPNTGGYDTWQSIMQTVNLSAGQHIMKVSYDSSGGFDLNYFDFKSAAPPNSPPTLTSPASAAPASATVGQNIAFNVAAIDPDGDALTYSWNFGDSASASGASTTHAYVAAGIFTATVSIDDGHGHSISSNVTVSVSSAQSGSLTATFGTAAASYNLTTLGASDWAHWGRGGVYGRFDHKASGGSQISNVTVVGSGAVSGGWSDAARSVTWTGGTPTASGTNDHGYIWSNGALNTGFSFTAPADTQTRTLQVYVGASNASATLTAHLSDGSAPDYSKSYTGPGAFIYTITYKALAANQTLKITLLKTGNNAGFTDGSADLDAAMLSIVPGTLLAAVAIDAIDLGSVQVKTPMNITLPTPAQIGSAKSTWTVAGKTKLPKGIRLVRNKLSGRTTVAGVYTFSVTIKTKQQTVTQSYQLTVNP
jgi:hypothetical protein